LLDPNAQFLSMRCRRISSNPEIEAFMEILEFGRVGRLQFF
jgi:hypothetical protein